MSKLVGLDGNPISSDTMHNPFKKNTIDDFPVLTQPELDEFYRAANQTLDQGIPLNIPTAMPLELLVRVAATLKKLSQEQQEQQEQQDQQDQQDQQAQASESAASIQVDETENVLGRLESLLRATKVLD